LSPDADVSLLKILTDSKLQVHAGHADEEQADKEGDEESSATVHVADCWKPPDVAKVDDKANDREEVFNEAVPAEAISLVGDF